MAKLTVEQWGPEYSGKRTMRIGGFGDGELSELKSMEHKEAEEKLTDMLDMRNNGIGTTWQCGYGVWSVWFDNEYAYMSIGTSCD